VDVGVDEEDEGSWDKSVVWTLSWEEAQMQKRESGFTLIELMIVIAIIAIIAAIAIPNLLAAKLSSNETAAIATLRNLTSAQAQIQASGKIDCDADGIGEYGSFPEMTGTIAVRTDNASGICSYATSGTAVSPAILSPSLAGTNATGFVTKAGYAFIIFLPDSTSGAAQFTTVGLSSGAVAMSSGTKKIAIDISETTWCAYAQPVAHGNSGNRRFFVNQSGDVMQSANDVAKGQGSSTLKGSTSLSLGGAESAFLGASITASVAVGTVALDGDKWKVTN
jgi:prepilin-type N-terminal cleavage/methylation domain-containing protein